MPNRKNCNIILNNKILRDNNISPMTKLVYGEMSLRPGISYKITAKELSILYNTTEESILRNIRELVKSGYLKEIEYSPSIIKHIIIKGEEKLNKCEWCGENSVVLQEHHYPIPKSKGGTETVNICPNCHYGFHYLENQIEVVR